jgi:hypothetical protein
MQQVQRVGHGLARHTKLFGKLALADAMTRRQGAVNNGRQDPRIGLIDQVWERF